MRTVKITHALGLSVVAALVTSAVPFTAASAIPAPTALSLTAASHDGEAFDVADYAAGDITVQVEDTTGPVDVDDAQDLSYSWSVTPFAPNAATVQVPTTGTSMVTTDVRGEFVVPLPISQGPGAYELTAELGPDVNGDNDVSSAALLTIRTGNAAPVDSTAVLTGLGGGTPGDAQGGTLTVTAPDNTYDADPSTAGVQFDTDSDADPVQGQVYSLTVDRGFFTKGDVALPSTAGADAGDLIPLGTKLTGVTDAAGEIEFQTGIARDTGFDDDGKVTATVRVAGGLAGSKTAAWDTVDTLNGRVALTLSPQSEQDGPVSPALAGNRTFYDVFALDQFGNRVGGQSISLAYTGNVDDYDYDGDEVLSDFDTFGDIWLTSFEAGTINVTGTWEDAPTYRYVDTAGTVVAGTADATGTVASSTYEIRFGAASFSIRSSATDTVKVGTPVTHTVRVTDQQGNPVVGYQVRFLRYGPDEARGEAASTTTTNALGEATYTFIGTARGRATITAEVTDGNSRRELTSSTVFGATIKARLAKGKGGPGGDRLAVKANVLAAGARVQVYKIVKGQQVLVATKKLSRKGTVAFKIRDRNRNRRTTYVAVVRSTSKSVADQSNTATIR